MPAIKSLTEDECARLLEFAANDSHGYKKTQTRCRNVLIILAMLDAGLRVGEVVSLIWTDLVFGGRPVTSLIIRSATTKTGKERIIPLTARLRDAIAAWQYHCLPVDILPPAKPVFFVQRSQDAMSTRQIQRLIADIGERSIGRQIWPHLFRHTFATRLMRIADIRTVQGLLGHESITSTQVYTHPTSEDEKKAIDALNPEKPSGPPIGIQGK